MDYKIEFGKKIQFYRKINKFTQEHLALLVDTTRGTIGRIERGQHFPQCTLLFNLAAVLNVKLVDLFDFENELNRIS